MVSWAHRHLLAYSPVRGLIVSQGNHYAAQADPSRNPQFQRRWTEPPACKSFKTVGKATANVVNAVAVNAVAHWLRQADQVDGQDRQTCLLTADSIMRTAGLCWGDLLPGRAA